MVFFPNCKINLGLTILRRRADGYHDLDTGFYPLPLRDVLEVLPSADGELHFTPSGLAIPGDPGGNLCLKAYHLLKTDFPDLPPVDIHLYKHIPMGAGLGGGSSDGAFMLVALNRLFGLGLGNDRLLAYAARLGSDCPFFILNRPCLGAGRGEQLQPLALDLSGYSFALVHPGVHISTAWAFSACTPRPDAKPVEAVLCEPIERWAGLLVNDFEAPILAAHPPLRLIKDALYAEGAIYASMTGSGSSFFGIFRKGQLPSPNFAAGWQVSLLD